MDRGMGNKRGRLGVNVALLSHQLQALRELNNFAGMFMINAALESASVFRLRHTFKVHTPHCLD